MKKIQLQFEHSQQDTTENNDKVESVENNDIADNIDETPETTQDVVSVGKAVAVKSGKIRWGIIGGACAIIVFYLTIAFVVSWMILNQIAAQTSHTASPFGTWWQVLLFVFDIIFVLGIAASFTMMALGIKKRGKANVTQQ